MGCSAAPLEGHNGVEDEARVRALLARLREAPPEDVRLVLVVLAELQRWRRGVEQGGD